MTVRAAVLGLGLALLIAASTYYNDWIIQQTPLIGSQLPISVFGGMSLALLAVNPLLQRLRPAWSLRRGEAAVIVALGLAGCGFAGSFYRFLPGLVAAPSHYHASMPHWQSAQIMSYVPGGSHALAAGSVTDWGDLAERVVAERERSTGAGRLYRALSPEGRRAWQEAADRRVDASLTQALVRSANQALAAGAVAGDPGAPAEANLRAGRDALVAAMPALVLPPPRGEPWLVGAGQADHPAVQSLIAGHDAPQAVPDPAEVPWAAWWPVMSTLSAAVVLLAVAGVGLALVVHPQWSRHELLAYPVARFVNLLSQTDDRSGLPALARSGLFWIGLGAMVVLHLVNGLHHYIPAVPPITRSLDLAPLGELFPTASRVPGSWGVFWVMVYPTVVAFACFIDRRTSLSLGLTSLAWVMFAAALLSQGVAISTDRMETGAGNFLRLGSFLAMAAVIGYTGRWYYFQVIRGAVTLGRSGRSPQSAIWGAWLLTAATALGVVSLVRMGFSPMLAVITAGLALLIWLVLARIVAETGMFLMAGPLLPTGVVVGLLGADAINPTQFVLIAVAGFALLGDSKDHLTLFAVNALKMTDDAGTRPSRAAPAFLLTALAGFALATLMTLTVIYHFGLPRDGMAGYANELVPISSFDLASRHSEALLTAGTLAEAMQMSDADRLRAFAPDTESLGWLALGFVLVIGCAVARLRLPWWPLHPVLFLLWGTWGAACFSTSLLIGWAIKSAVVGCAGVAGYRKLVPLAVGVIAGELMMGLFWMIVATIYFQRTGIRPPMYAVFPI
ncbi:MAG: DUF6785 family protein [Phycisphaeraceae bacterium]